jgi:hypothetical protein
MPSPAASQAPDAGYVDPAWNVVLEQTRGEQSALGNAAVPTDAEISSRVTSHLEPIVSDFRGAMGAIGLPQSAAGAAVDWLHEWTAAETRRLGSSAPRAEVPRQHSYPFSVHDAGLTEREYPAFTSFLNKMAAAGASMSEAGLAIGFYRDSLKKNFGSLMPLKRK